MAQKKLGSIVDEHIELGKALYIMRTLTMDIFMQLSKAYPKNHWACLRFGKLIDTLDNLRSELDGHPMMLKKIKIDHVNYPPYGMGFGEDK